MNNGVFEVYVCSYNNENLYVGQGKSGRHKHCNSGCSHVYELNKLHFDGVVFDVEVVFVDSDASKVLDMEKKLIRDLKPKFNVVHNIKVSNGTSNIKDFKKLLETKDSKLYYKYICQISNGYDDMKVLYKSLNLSKPFVPETARVYDRMGLKGMRCIAANFYGVSNYGKYFVECFNNVFTENLNDK